VVGATDQDGIEKECLPSQRFRVYKVGHSYHQIWSLFMAAWVV